MQENGRKREQMSTHLELKKWIYRSKQGRKGKKKLLIHHSPYVCENKCPSSISRVERLLYLKY